MLNNTFIWDYVENKHGITKDLQRDSVDLVQSIGGAIIGGSYCIDPENAHDIDIVVPNWTPLPEGFTITSRDDAEYDRSDVSCLEATARDASGKINLLFVTAPYLAAYYAAIHWMLENPMSYKTRDSRVSVHSYYEDKVRTMLTQG